jgi:hypothetical protein
VAHDRFVVGGEDGGERRFIEVLPTIDPLPAEKLPSAPDTRFWRWAVEGLKDFFSAPMPATRGQPGMALT